MSIRFKFRSSVNFDTIEIDGGRPYITVGELRSKILCQKKLNISNKDFDLVFSDASTSQEYNDDKFEIPSGSSVIIKRVPVEPVPSAMLGHQKLEASELSEGLPKGSDHNVPEKVVLEKMVPEFEEHKKLDKLASGNGIDLQSAGLPSELRCPLCNTYFKEAVMIPCCQHSFCETCIREVLIATGRCPKCSSSKCRIEHLLPNLCLRRAIEHFLESQILAAAPEIDLQKYVPDGESGIQGKEVSCAVPVTRRKSDFHNSTSAMDKGSNENVAESAYELLNKKNTFLEGSGFHMGNSNVVGLQKSTRLLEVKHSGRDRARPEDLAPVADSQGENQPISISQAHMPDEADSNIKKRGLWVDAGGGDRSFAVGNRNNKADRTCYMCGSPDHFIRDCPIASNQHSMFHTGHPMYQGGVPGYATPYWSGAFPPVSPYMNMYGSPGLVPFMVPVSPYGGPHYDPSAYGGLAVPTGMMRMRGLAPLVRTGVEQPLMHTEILELQNEDKRGKIINEKRGRLFEKEDEPCHKRHRYDELERSAEYKSHRDRGKMPSNSEDSHERTLRREHRGEKHLEQNIQSADERYEKRSHSSNAGRDRRSYHTDRSISGVEDVHYSNDRYDESRHIEHCKSSRRHHERREQSGSDSSWSRHRREKGVKRRAGFDVGDIQHKHNSYLSSSKEPSSSEDQEKHCKDISHSHGFRESRDRARPATNEFCRDRWQMVSSPDEDLIKGYHQDKRKRVL